MYLWVRRGNAVIYSVPYISISRGFARGADTIDTPNVALHTLGSVRILQSHVAPWMSDRML